MIRFVEHKVPDLAFVGVLLDRSLKAGQWTNFGPVSRKLEQVVHTDLGLRPTRSLVACSSGTAALFALVSLYGFLSGRPLRWVVSSFTFRCQRQGPLADAIVVDCNERGILDVDTLKSLDPDGFDGVILTPLFGMPQDLALIETWCRRAGKKLLVDAATCIGAMEDGAPVGSIGDGAAFSLHHTKPLGFGEGGFAVVPAQHEDATRSLLNFGRYGKVDTGIWSTNGKLSDPAAAFLLDRWRARDSLRAAHVRNYRRIEALATKAGCTTLTVLDDAEHFPSCVPLLLPTPHTLATDTPLPWMRYYEPLALGLPMAANLFSRILCLPCHPGLDAVTDAAVEATLATALQA